MKDKNRLLIIMFSYIAAIYAITESFTIWP